MSWVLIPYADKSTYAREPRKETSRESLDIH